MRIIFSIWWDKFFESNITSIRRVGRAFSIIFSRNFTVKKRRSKTNHNERILFLFSACDGRLIFPEEIKLLSDDNEQFVFYAVLMDVKSKLSQKEKFSSDFLFVVQTPTEKQIFPLGTNNYVQQADQIYFLFNNHPQYNAFTSGSCKNCEKQHEVFLLDNQQLQIETKRQRFWSWEKFEESKFVWFLFFV